MEERTRLGRALRWCTRRAATMKPMMPMTTTTETDTAMATVVFERSGIAARAKRQEKKAEGDRARAWGDGGGSTKP